MQPESGENAFGSNWFGGCSSKISWNFGSLHHAEYQECEKDFMDHAEAAGRALCDGHGVFGKRADGEVSKWKPDHFRRLSG